MVSTIIIIIIGDEQVPVEPIQKTFFFKLLFRPFVLGLSDFLFIQISMWFKIVTGW